MAEQRGGCCRDAAVPFKVGETLNYDVTWSGMLVAGTATAKVVERKISQNTATYALMAEGRPRPIIARLYPLYYKMDALMDTSTLLSQWTGLYTEEGDRRRQTATFFDRPNRKAFYEMPSEPAIKDTFTIPADVQDGLTLLYAMRAKPIARGQRITANVADDGLLYTAEFEPTGPEAVTVPYGTVNAWNVRVRILDAQKQEAGKNVGVWISNDARRLPLRIEADLPVGKFTLLLREVTR